MLKATRQGFSRLLVFGLALGLVGLVGQTSMAQESETYDMSFQAPNSIGSHEDPELVVHVKNSHGQPVNGVPVVFQVDPAWQGAASIFPERVLTHNGVAHARLRVDLIGVVGVTARVGTLTKKASIAVTSDSSAGPNQF